MLGCGGRRGPVFFCISLYDIRIEDSDADLVIV